MNVPVTLVSIVVHAVTESVVTLALASKGMRVQPVELVSHNWAFFTENILVQHILQQRDIYSSV